MARIKKTPIHDNFDTNFESWLTQHKVLLENISVYVNKSTRFFLKNLLVSIQM